MSSQGGPGEQPHDQTPPFGRPAEAAPWPQYPPAPVDPSAAFHYPEQPPGFPPPQPPFGPSHGSPPPPGYGPLPYYPGAYDPYLGYPPAQHPTNGLAIASLVTSIAGVIVGIPLTIFCFIGVLIPVVGAVLGGVALAQIRQTHQQGRGMAIAGVAIGASTAVVLVIVFAVLVAALHSLTMLN